MEMLRETPVACTIYLGGGVVCNKISLEDIRFLRNMLLSSKSEDAYVRSPLYFAFTGRNGLWDLRIRSYKCIACIHPNDRTTLLLFIPFVYDESCFKQYLDDLTNTLKFGPSSPLFKFFADFHHVHIARVPKAFLGLDPLGSCNLNPGFKIHREDKLDWIFPSYDVLLERSAVPKGPELAAYRNKLNKYKNSGVSVAYFDDVPAQDRDAAICRISQRWAERKAAGGKHGCGPEFSVEDLKEPYEYLADLALNPAFSLNGIFLKRGGEFIAFWLWENNGSRKKAVASVAALCASYEPGCAEYLHYQAARRLLELGYEEMCIGGSESEGLDAFKQKFCPIRKHELCTVKLDIYQIANLPMAQQIAAIAA
jgi:hypothetical protein